MTTPNQTPKPPEKVTSVDKLAMNSWRFGECNGFVVKDWTGVEKSGDPAIMVLKPSDIFDFIATATEQKRKVAIYAIGPCVLDWS